MPEYWEPAKEVQNKTVVPISRALKVIRSLVIGASLTTKNGISIFKQPGKYKIVVAASRSKGGDTFLDSELLALVDNNNFEKVSDRMTATLQESLIDQFILVLQVKFNDNISLTPPQYELIKNEIPIKEKRNTPTVVMLPKQSSSEVEQLELEAMALEIELELLNFAA
jgi:hypothetical protein